MKKAMIVLMCLMAVSAKAQLINSFKDFHSLTEDQAVTVFGSVNAYNMEAGMEYNSSHHRLVMLIGAKLWWLQEVPTYMAEKLGCSRNIDSDPDPIHSHFKVSPAITGGDDDATPVDIICTFNDSLRIVKVKMTRNKDLLIKLFVYRSEE